MNALDLISSSMRLVGALASGETPTGAEASDAFLVLNQMLDSWTADRLTVFTTNIGEFSLTPGQQTYTYGAGGNFNAARPAKITSASIVSLSNPAQPLELPIEMYSDDDWQSIPLKNFNTTLPMGVYDDGGFPLRSLTYIGIPTAAVKTRLYSWSPLSQFPDLVTDVPFPPGYPEALRYNLALRLIAEMPGEYNPIMVATAGTLAVESLARIKSINLPVIQATIDPILTGGSGHYNYLNDRPVGGRG